MHARTSHRSITDMMEITFFLLETLGRHWFQDFMLRNKSKIKFIKEQKLERSRKDGFTETVRMGWFDTVFDVLQQHNLFDKPGQIYNVDECGFNDDTQRKFSLS